MLSGYQAVYDADFFDAIRYAHANRFDYVSFDLNVPRFYIDQLERHELDHLRGYAEALGVGLAFHAPGDNVSLFADYPAIRRGILKHFSAIIDAADVLQARHVTVHAGIHPSLKQANAREDDFSQEYEEYFSIVLYENLSYLAHRTTHALLCVENFHFTPLTMQVIAQLLADNDRLFLTWDIAKTYDIELQLNQTVEDFMRQHADRLREVHAHDIIPGFRSHQIIGEGGIDFARYADILGRPEIGVTIEVRPREAALVSRDRLVAVIQQGEEIRLRAGNAVGIFADTATDVSEQHDRYFADGILEQDAP